MFGQTYMINDDDLNMSENHILMNRSGGKRPKRHTVNMSTEVFAKLREYVVRRGRTKEDVVNQAVDDYIEGRENFLKLYAPHITLEAASSKAIMLNDSELNKMILVRVMWRNIEKEPQKRGLISLLCESCNSDSCIHVRYSLAFPGINRLQKQEKLV